MCWPTLQGFSFAAKKWGEIDVDHCDSIGAPGSVSERGEREKGNRERGRERARVKTG